MDRYRLISSGIAQGFIAANDKVTLIAFRGSERDLDDWDNNIDTGLVPGPFRQGERIHRGFSTGLKTVIDELEERVKKLGKPGAPLMLTGHSLGGALATLLAAKLYASGRAPHSVYTFGSPRVGCRTFRNIYEDRDDERTFRVVNRHDIVARIPPRLLRYRHVGLLRYLDADGELHDDLNFWERMLLYLDPAGRDAKTYVKDLAGRLPGAFDDHKMTSYLAKIEKLAARGVST